MRKLGRKLCIALVALSLIRQFREPLIIVIGDRFRVVVKFLGAVTGREGPSGKPSLT